eukprot:GHVU01044208.1.p1 GENE.GHVU01044208.1~~GHVU01044208.1.p1  ORF type:complete len:135 (+),score=4.65 GHVU01044208.1:3-407(+)
MYLQHVTKACIPDIRTPSYTQVGREGKTEIKGNRVNEMREKGKSRRLACRPDCQLSQRIHQVTWGTTRTSHRLPSQFVGRLFAGDGPADRPQEAAPSGAVSCIRHVRVTTPGPGAVSMPPSPLGYLPTDIGTRS